MYNSFNFHKLLDICQADVAVNKQRKLLMIQIKISLFLQLTFRFCRMLERERNPVESMWSGLSRDARNLNYVKESLTEAALYYAADFISVNVLRGKQAMNDAKPLGFIHTELLCL